MNRIIFFFICLSFITGCSLHKNSKFWTKSQNIPEENNLGLDDYMDFTNAQQGGSLLSDVIDNQFAEIITALNGLNDPLSNEVVVNNAQGLQAYDKLQQLVPLIKVDMTSALGVLITYQDNDGD